MKKTTILKIAAILLVIAAIAALGLWLQNQMFIDSCLDRGGRWSAEGSICEGVTEH